MNKSKQEIISILNEFKTKLISHSGEKENPDCYLIIESQFDSLAERLSDGWVKVDDRFPENDDDVLVIYKKTTSSIGDIFIGYCINGEWCIPEPNKENIMSNGNAGNFHGGDMYFVTHWRNLPTLPPNPEKE